MLNLLIINNSGVKIRKCCLCAGLQSLTVVIPACAKFPFMDGNDLEIGPCYTYSAFRGKGIYLKVLSEICRRGNDTLSFYMIVDEINKRH